MEWYRAMRPRYRHEMTARDVDDAELVIDGGITAR
jgi:hypothetical protein